MRPTSDLYDIHGDALGVLPPTLRHYGARTRFHGPAVTVRTHEVNEQIKALAQSPGDGRVMVVDGGGSARRALVGDVVAGAALSNGWAGLVIWGAVRDVEALAALDIGVMALVATPRRCALTGPGETGLAIRIDGVSVAPGDTIVADADGALVFPAGGPTPG